jgi:hypothetical protein
MAMLGNTARRSTAQHNTTQHSSTGAMADVAALAADERARQCRAREPEPEPEPVPAASTRLRVPLAADGALVPVDTAALAALTRILELPIGCLSAASLLSLVPFPVPFPVPVPLF